MFARPSSIFLSDRSYRDILNETSQHLATETGGVLIGDRRENKWFVVESIDPGPRAVLQHSYFEYDQTYVNHLSNKVRKRYAAPLKLLGLWHRHPGSFDRFSETDDNTHRRYLQQGGGAIISGLVNIDPVFRFTFYIVDGEPPQHQKTPYMVGDHHFPPDLLRTLDEHALLSRVNACNDFYSWSTQEMQIIGNRQSLSSGLGGMLNSTSEPSVGQCPQGASADRREASSKITADPVADEALEMLDEELEYLDSQGGFRYELQMSTAGVLLTMQKVSDPQNLESSVRFLFTVEDQQRIVKQGNESYRFRKGIVEEVIGRIFS